MRTTTSSPRDDDVTAARATRTDGFPGGPAAGAGAADGPAVRSRRASLPGDPQAAAAARRFVRATFADWTGRRLTGAEGLTDRLADEAVLLVSELVTNAVVHAGTTVELRCRLDPEPGRDGDPQAYRCRDREPYEAPRREAAATLEPTTPPAPASSSRSPTTTPPSRSAPVRRASPPRTAGTGSS